MSSFFEQNSLNKLISLREAVFQNNLHHLNDQTTFSNMSILQKLDLSDNKIERVHPNILNKLSEL